MRTIAPIERADRPWQAEGPQRSQQGASLESESGSVPFSTVMRRLAGEVDRGERVVTQALRQGPGANDVRAMIALQAGVYRYVEAVDLVSRLVDRAAQAVKTTLQNQ
jgi:hypothetical protein